MNLKSYLLFPILTFLLTSLTFSASAQAPLQIPYQGVARDAQGAALQNQLVTLRLTIEDGSGTNLFQEIHQTTTNQFGLFNVKIGDVIPLNIDWSNGTKFLHVEMDPAGGNSYTDLGSTQFLSVPYALYAETSNNPGPQGPAGVGIANVVIQNNHLIVTLSDGSVQDAGAVLSEGCTNAESCNYNSSAVYDNGSCLTVSQPCNDGNANTYNDVIDVSCSCAGTPSNFELGMSYGGGVVAYLDSTEQHGFIVALSDIAQAPQGCYGLWIYGTSGAVGTGQANTSAILSACSTPGIAARLCDEYVLNGYDDWYLPSIGELQLCYDNLYLNGAGNFAGYWYYWSSSIGNEYYGPSFTFQNGGPYDVNRQDALFVRPMRSF